jgi:hypothetical protein
VLSQINPNKTKFNFFPLNGKCFRLQRLRFSDKLYFKQIRHVKFNIKNSIKYILLLIGGEFNCQNITLGIPLICSTLETKSYLKFLEIGFQNELGEKDFLTIVDSGTK